MGMGMNLLDRGMPWLWKASALEKASPDDVKYRTDSPGNGDVLNRKYIEDILL